MGKYINFNYNFNSNAETRAERIAQAGFDGVFLYSEDNPRGCIETIRSRGLDIETLHLPYKKYDGDTLVDSRYVNMLWCDGDESDRYVNELFAQIELAKEFHIKTVIMHITGGDDPPPFIEDGIKRIEKVLRLCERHDIVLCLENLRRLDYLKYTFDNINSDNLKFCFDSGHAHAMTHNLTTFPWETFADKLYCLHLHDNFGGEDSHLIPLKGNIEWKSLVAKLFHINPNLNLTLEVRADQRQRVDGEEVFLKACMDGLNAIEKLVRKTNKNEGKETK